MTFTPIQGTAAAGKSLILAALLMNGAPSSTVSEANCQTVPTARSPALIGPRSTSRSRSSSSLKGASQLENLGTSLVANIEIDHSAMRPTTALEKVVGELRRWSFLKANWDGEGAAAPALESLRNAESFVRAYGDIGEVPEPMLNANGRAGLFWKLNGLYADLEFLGDSRLAYYIERNGDKHKGVTQFNPEEVPALFQLLLRV